MIRTDLGNGAWIEVKKQFVKDDLSVLGRLFETLPLRQESIRLYGRDVPTPRLYIVAW